MFAHVPQARIISEAASLPQATSFARQGKHHSKSSDLVDKSLLFAGGEGETRTPAPVSRPTPLAGAPRHQLEYFSMVTSRVIQFI